MSNFFSRTSGTSAGLTPEEAGLTAGVLTLTLTGEFTDLDKRSVSLFRDEYFRLSPLDEDMFQSTMTAAQTRVTTGNFAGNLPAFVSGTLLPALVTPEDKIGVYRYVYALAMSDLNINDGENALMQAIRQAAGIEPAQFDAAEQAVLTEFQALYRAIASISLGLMVVTADGKADQSELDDIRKNRTLLEPLGRLDDTQFELVYDLGLTVHDRFLLDVTARKDFVTNILANLLSSRDVRYQAFRYAASVATADGDIAQVELDMLKDVLNALGIRDEVGDQLIGEFMSRVRTIDGKPRL
jgi:tellurite resistance protein